MIQVSDNYAELIDTGPYRLQLTLADGTVVPKKAVRSAEWSGSSNAGDDFTLGSTVAATLTVELDRTTLGEITLADARLQARLVLDAGEAPLEIPWGDLQVTEDDSDDDTVTIGAGDAMLWAFNTEYALDDEALGFDWEAGVDGETLLQAICDACGVTLGTTGLRQITLKYVSPAGYTYREVIAFLACMWGRFARINAAGELVLQWYEYAERPVTASRYYSGELVKADYIYTVGYIKCYVKTLEETLVVGDATQSQGIYIKCPWMTLEDLQAVWEDIGGFTYRPVSELAFLGDPRLEPGDIITVTDRDGSAHLVPCMTLCHQFDGGLITEITAVGKSSSASEQDYQGPVTRAIERAVQSVNVSLIKYEDRINAKVASTDGRVSEIEQAADYIEQRVENAEGDIAQLQLDSSGLESRVQSAEGEISILQQNSGMVRVAISDQNGTLQTIMDAGDWEVLYKTLTGEVTSGLYFDFTMGRFVFDGTGVFRSKDGNTYIEIVGNELVMYSKYEATGEYLDKIHLGFMSGSDPSGSGNTIDYPYMLLGKASGDVGMIKKFYNGLWIGNSVPINATGNFNGMDGAAGIFINTRTATTYVVNGTDMQNVYTGEATAKFG